MRIPIKATVREPIKQVGYIWLPGAGYAGTDLPLAVVDGVDTATPALYHVHADHLGRPVKATNAAKASVWDAVWTPWGAPHSLTGSLALDARLPGQWFQLEAGLHYNWHRHYDPSLGRYTQPDPLGFVDGPSVYAYALSNPLLYVDPDGRRVTWKQVKEIIHVCLEVIDGLFGTNYSPSRPTRPPRPPIERRAPDLEKPRQPKAPGKGKKDNTRR